MFTNFTEDQKDLFWEVIQELPINFDNSKEEDIEYIEMKIENGEPLNKENQRALRHSSLLLRLLKEVMLWKDYDEGLEKKKSELVEMLLAAAKRKEEIKNKK